MIDRVVLEGRKRRSVDCSLLSDKITDLDHFDLYLIN